MTQNFYITKLGTQKGFGVEFFSKDADEIRRHCGDFDLYVTNYAENKNGEPWRGMNDGTPYIKGISVSSSDENSINWFVGFWVKRGILEPVKK